MKLREKLNEMKLSRRSFLGLSAAAAAAAVLPGCAPEHGVTQTSEPDVPETSTEAEMPIEHSEPEGLPEGGKWVSAICNYNCGGLCVNKAYVVDNTIIRQKTDDCHEDTPNFPQQRGCARGRAHRKSVTAVDRLKYPMKRKHFEEGGGGKKELRGEDQWVRITWDEALDIIANEYKRVIAEYGNKAILRGSMTYALSRFSLAMGGMVRSWGPVSYGAWPIPLQRMTGMSALAMYLNGTLTADATVGHLSSSGGGAVNTCNDRLDLRNSKLIVLWGSNPAWSSAGNPTYHIAQAKAAGAKVITVDPMYSATATAVADEWIPVRPATDAALLLGMAYHMIDKNLQDQDFLDKYTIGFDAAHMPEGANAQDNFKDYVLGTYDGIPKTPEWASEICGTPVDVIKSFAEELATTKPCAFMASYAPARTYNGEMFCQAFLTVGWMTGNVGKSGACVGPIGHFSAFNHGFRLVNYGSDKLPGIANPLWTAAGYCIPPQDPNAEGWFGPALDDLWKAVIDGKFLNGPKGMVDIDVHIIDNMTYGNSLNQTPNANMGIEAFRKVDFVCTADMFPTPTVQYSDVVVPVTHAWERVGCTSNCVPNRETIIWGSQVIEPTFECKDDDWIQAELGKRCGIDESIIRPISLQQQIFNKIAGATVIKEDRTFEPLVTITEEDLKFYGVEGEVQEGRIPIRQLQEQGYYQVPREEGDNYGFIAFEDYVRDPENFPVKTDSGKFEIYCPSLAQWIRDYGYTTISPIAKYVPPLRGYEDAQSGPYSLQVINPHYPRRAHSIHDNNTWLREAFGQELYMSCADAKARGIEDGDTVKIYNEYGTVIRRAKVTNRITKGVIALGDGGWMRQDGKGYDEGGCPNMLHGNFPSGEGTSGWNCNVAEVEKYTDVTLDPDYMIPPVTIELA